MVENKFPEKIPCFFKPKSEVCSAKCPLHDDMVANINFVASIQNEPPSEVINALQTAPDGVMAIMASRTKARFPQIAALCTPDSTKFN